MQKISDSEQYLEATLAYCFWLPAGKDEFGFARATEAPLSGTAFYRKGIEVTIAEYLSWQAGRLQGSVSELAGMTIIGDLEPQDAELGLRKVQYQFKYEPTCPQLTPLIKDGPISGSAIVLSNGLYLWAFKICYRHGTDDRTIKEALIRFLKHDFVLRHVQRLFNFSWTSIPDVSRSYSEGTDVENCKTIAGSSLITNWTCSITGCLTPPLIRTSLCKT